MCAGTGDDGLHLTAHGIRIGLPQEREIVGLALDHPGVGPEHVAQVFKELATQLGEPPRPVLALDLPLGGIGNVEERKRRALFVEAPGLVVERDDQFQRQFGEPQGLLGKAEERPARFDEAAGLVGEAEALDVARAHRIAVRMGPARKADEPDRRFGGGVAAPAADHHRSRLVVVASERGQFAPAFRADQRVAAAEIRLRSLIGAAVVVQIGLVGKVRRPALGALLANVEMGRAAGRAFVDAVEERRRQEAALDQLAGGPGKPHRVHRAIVGDQHWRADVVGRRQRRVGNEHPAEQLLARVLRMAQVGMHRSAPVVEPLDEIAHEVEPVAAQLGAVDVGLAGKRADHVDDRQQMQRLCLPEGSKVGRRRGGAHQDGIELPVPEARLKAARGEPTGTEIVGPAKEIVAETVDRRAVVLGRRRRRGRLRRQRGPGSVPPRRGGGQRPAALHDLADILDINGLRHHRVEALAIGLVGQKTLDVCGDGDEPGMRRLARLVEEPRDHFQAVHLRKMEIEQRNVIAARQQGLERGRSVAGDGDAVAALLQDQLKEVLGNRTVLCNQNVRRCRRLRSIVSPGQHPRLFYQLNHPLHGTVIVSDKLTCSAYAHV